MSKRIFISLLASFLACTVWSQVRMSTETELLLDQYLNSSQASAIAASFAPIKPELSRGEHINGESYIPLLAIKNPGTDLSELNELGAIVIWTSNTHLNMLFPVNELHAISDLTCLDYIETPGHIYPDLDRAVYDLRADSVHRGIGLDMGYTGKDVIIGVIDWGFDYTHPMFYDTLLENYRILAAWDQFKKSGPAPTGYSYGTAYYGKDDLIAAGSDTSGHSSGYDTHGTHVTGIAAGSGAGTKYRGVAYDAELLFASPDRDVSAYIDAIHWMKSIADREGKRLVVNMSFGNYHKATMDGNSIGSEAIKEMMDAGVVMVTSAGNNGNRRMHIQHEFDNDTIRSGISFLGSVSTEELWGQTVIMWGSQQSDFGVQYLVYDVGRNLVESSRFFHTSVDRSDEGFYTDGTDTFFFKMTADSAHPVNDRAHMVMKFRLTNQRWDVAIAATSDDSEVHFWNVVEGERSTKNWGRPFVGMFPGWLSGNDSFTVSDPGTTETVITVGAHISEIRVPNIDPIPGDIAGFSSHGPVMGRTYVKPDLSAPGVGVASSISSFTTDDFEMIDEVSFDGRTYPFARFSGTSMSSPALTGVAALVLQANPSLSAYQVKEILKATTREDVKTQEIETGGNSIWGTGKTTAYRAIQLALATEGEMVAETYGVLFPNPTTSRLYYADSEDTPTQDCEVLNELGQVVLQGRIDSKIGMDVSALAQGIYLIRLLESGDVLRFVKL